MTSNLRLRPYKPCDAEKIVSWCKDEKTFILWGGDHFGSYPITPEIMNRKYLDNNGDCTECDNFYPMTAFDDEGIVGHFILRYLNGDNRLLRIGWVIVDDTKRGRKYGQQMLRLGLEFAFEILQAETVTIGVFENNAPAYHCYLSAGFRKSTILEDSVLEINGEQWKVVELEMSREDYCNISVS